MPGPHGPLETERGINLRAPGPRSLFYQRGGGTEPSERSVWASAADAV